MQNNVDVKLYQANGSVIPNTTSVIANGTATITVQGTLPTDNIYAKSSITTNNLTYAKRTNNDVSDTTENVTVTSENSDQVNVTVAMEAKNGGIKLVKGIDFNFNNFNNFISNAPANSRFAWAQSLIHGKVISDNRIKQSMLHCLITRNKNCRYTSHDLSICDC